MPLRDSPIGSQPPTTEGDFPSGHPTPDQLADYFEARSRGEEADTVRRHLVECTECSDLVLELADLAEGVRGGELSQGELDAAWDTVRVARGAPERSRTERDRADRGAVRPAPSVAPAAASRGTTRPRPKAAAGTRRAWLAAACLALIASGFAIWGLTQQRQIDRLRLPSVNPPLVNLMPQGAVRSSGELSGTLSFSTGDRRAWLVLNPENTPTADRYRVRFTDEEDRTVLTLAGLQPSELGAFRLELPRQALPPGEYRILLEAEDDQASTPTEVFLLRLFRS